jgi:hypothetical protein
MAGLVGGAIFFFGPSLATTLFPAHLIRWLPAAQEMQLS